MRRYIPAKKLIEYIKSRRDGALERQKNLEKIGQETILNEMIAFELNRLISFVVSLQQEQSEQKKNCAGCSHCIDRKDQYGWHFKGCFGGPYNGKFIAEIDECPLKQELPKVDLEKILSGFTGYYAHENSGEYPSAIDIARHFYELGLSARKNE